ncbi:predicted protein [Botrytis cinerea T4]|uniref:Uncharacterized protein n=1 Tax=Botryotinia fuckeliana (strain T4) TaxID=999810 RepID=G2XTB2_BOTF4|nr:predicted protein [Botrytis cinerea T4]
MVLVHYHSACGTYCGPLDYSVRRSQNKGLQLFHA